MTKARTEPGEQHQAGQHPTSGDATHLDVDPDRHERVTAIVERFAADLTEAGMQRMAARVFACLLVSEEGALSSAELAERLRVSPAAISGAVRYLAQTRMLSRERAPGSRRELYRVHEEIWYEAFANRDVLLNQWSNTLGSAADSLGRDTAPGRRLAETSEFFAFLRDEMTKSMARWRARKERERQERADQDTDQGSDQDSESPGHDS